MPTREAQRLAEQRGLDLVEITPNATPPVCKIMDYGKFKYEESIRAILCASRVAMTPSIWPLVSRTRTCGTRIL